MVGATIELMDEARQGTHSNMAENETTNAFEISSTQLQPSLVLIVPELQIRQSNNKGHPTPFFSSPDEGIPMVFT